MTNKGYVVLILVLVMTFLGSTFTASIKGRTISVLKSAAIEHGCAAYDSKTGEWEWLEK